MFGSNIREMGIQFFKSLTRWEEKIIKTGENFSAVVRMRENKLHRRPPLDATMAGFFPKCLVS